MQLAEDRRQRIVETVEQQGKVLAAELAVRFHTSEDTIRRDLRDLDAAGLLRRVHGGAMRRTRVEPSFVQRLDANSARKLALAQTIIEAVRPGDTILVDAGTTNLAFARLLEDGLAAAIITNSPQVAFSLNELRRTKIILLGGTYATHLGAVMGAQTVGQIQRLRVNLSVVGACSVEVDRGLGATDAEEAAVKHAMLAAGSRRVVASLNERLEAPAPFLIAPLGEVDQLVVEADAAPDVLARLRKLERGPEVKLAGEAEDVKPRYTPAHRWAISTLFLLNGAMIGIWAAHVPVVQARAGIDTGVLGFLLLTIAGGAISAMPLAGVLLGRWGTRPVAIAGGCLFAAACAALMSVTSVVPLFAAGYMFGFTNGTLGVSMNANASETEAARGIPTMSSIHGFWSLGGLAGAALGGLLIGAGMGDGRGAMLASAVMAAGVLLLCGPRLLATPPSPHATHFALPRGRALFLGLLGLLAFAVEGALVDWSALLVTSRTGAPLASAALGYSAFSVTMAACRFAGDRLVLRFGALRVMRAGGLGLCAGLMLAVVSTQLWLAALGFALIGLSAANVVPVLFSAAARIPGMSAGGGLATVATLGSAGLLMAPPLIGAIAAHTSLAVALGLLSLSGIVIAANARIVVRGGE